MPLLGTACLLQEQKRSGQSTHLCLLLGQEPEKSHSERQSPTDTGFTAGSREAASRPGREGGKPETERPQTKCLCADSVIYEKGSNPSSDLINIFQGRIGGVRRSTDTRFVQGERLGRGGGVELRSPTRGYRRQVGALRGLRQATSYTHALARVPNPNAFIVLAPLGRGPASGRTRPSAGRRRGPT